MTDLNEPNNQAYQATSLELDSISKNNSIYPLQDVDWFKFTISSYSDVTINTSVYPAYIFCTIYTEPDDTSMPYLGATSSFPVKISGMPANTYYLKFYSKSSSYSSAQDNIIYSYDVSLKTASPGPGHTSDQYETNNTPDMAYALTNGARLTDMSLFPAQDIDWFKFTLTDNKDIGIWFDKEHENINIYLYKLKEGIQTPSTTDDLDYLSYSSNSNLVRFNNEPGVYYVKIYPVYSTYTYSGITLNFNTFSSVSETDNPYIIDLYEPDNSSSQAVGMTPGTPHEHHFLYSTAETTDNYDYVKFRVPEKSDISVSINSPLGNSVGDISLYTRGDIYYNNNYYGLYKYVYAKKSLDLKGILPGYYNVRVDRAGSITQVPDYSINVNLTPSNITEDIYEPDNSIDNFSIYSSSTQNRTIFPAADKDYIKFTLTQPSDVDIRTECGPDLSINAVLYFADNNATTYYDIDPKTESIKVMGLQAGNYVIQINETTNDQCGDYSLTINTAPSVFKSDNYEISSSVNNNTPEQAVSIPAGSEIKDLSIYPAQDIDWFKFTLSSAQHATIDLNLSSLETDQERISMYLYNNPDQDPISIRDYYSTYTEPQIKMYSLLPGTYYIKICSYDNNIPFGLYNISLTTEDPQTGDSWETLNSYAANYDDSWQNAALVSTGVTTENHTIHHYNDTDWFKFTLAGTNKLYDLQINYDYDSAYSPNFYFYYSDPEGSRYYSWYNNTVILKNIKSGTNYIKVFNTRTISNPVSYNFKITATDSGSITDIYEPNDSVDSAYTILSGATLENSSLNPTTDTDWYKFTISNPDNKCSNIKISVKTNTENTSAYYYTVLYNSSMYSLTSRYSYYYDNPNILQVNNVDNGTYFIKLYLDSYYGSTIENYSVNLSVTEGSYTADTTDISGSDDTYENATLLTKGTAVTGRSLHSTYDVDWYKFIIPDTYQSNDVTLTFTGYPSTQLLDNDLKTINTSTYNSNLKYVFAMAPGTYYIKAGNDTYSYNTPVADYSVMVDWTNPVITDLNEPNNTASSAKPYTPGTELTALQLHNPADQDWYVFELTETSAITAGITVEDPNATSSYTYLNIYSEKNLDSPVCSVYSRYNYSYNSNKTVDFIEAGKYYARIYLNSYSAPPVSSYKFKISSSTAPVIDLELQSVTVSPQVNVDVGDYITFTLSVKNKGETFKKGHYYTLFIDGEAASSYNNQPDPDNPSVYITARGQYYLPDSEEFKVGEVKTIELTWFAEARAHSFSVGVDSNNYLSQNNLIVETDETNNFYYGTFPFELNFSDLKITNVTISPDPNKDELVSNGSIVNFYATVQNWGDSFSKSHWYSLRISRKAIRTVNGVTEEYEYWPWYTKTVSSMGFAAGEEKIINLQWIGEPGEHLNYEIKADTYGYVQEKDENNNTATGTFQVSLEKSDLVAGAINVVLPETIQQGSQIHFDINVTNASTAYVDTYHRYELYLDSVKKAETYSYGYQGSETKTVRLTWTAEPGAYSNYEIRVDTTNRVPEDNENNNTSSGTFNLNVAQCDITVTALEIPGVVWENATLKDGQEVNLTATVTNPEPGNVTGSFLVSLVVDGKNIQSRYIQGLAANSSEDVPFNWLIRGGSNQIKVIADTNNNIVEKNETNNEFSRNIASFATPDIQVTDLQIVPSTGLKDGSEIEIIATIANMGTGGTAKSFWVGFSIDDANAGRISIPGLQKAGDSGDSKNIKLTASLKAGNSNITVKADTYDSVGESDETNNTKELAIPPIEMPNLKVTDLTINSQGLCDGRELIARFKLSNVGSGSTERDIYSIFYVDDKQMSFWTHPGGLASGASTEVIAKWPFAAGTKKLSVQIDPYNNISESNLSDNEMSIVLPDVPLADITVSALGWEPRLYALNDLVTVYAVIKNSGQGRTEKSFEVNFRVDDLHVHTGTVDVPLDPGATESVSFSWKGKPGKELKIVADHTNLINEGEAGEQNNIKTEELPEIPLPDLEVQELTWVDPVSPSQGDIVSFHAKIKNKGKAYANAFQIALYVDNRQADSRKIMGGLWADLDVELDLNWTITAFSGTTAEIKVIADNYKSIPESADTRADNTLTKVMTLNIPGVDFKMESIEIKKGDTVITSTDAVAPGDILTFTATLSNQGPGNYSKPVDIGFYTGWKLFKNVKLNSIDSGQTKSVSAEWEVPKGQYHDLKVVADTYDMIPEILGGESNNTLVSALPKVPPESKPELIIKSVTNDFDASKADYKEGDPINFDIQVQNTGTADIADNIPVVMNVKTESLTKSHTFYIIGGLKASETKSASALDFNGLPIAAQWPVIPRDSAQFTISADPYDKIDETNESNNSYALTLQFFKRALKPTDIILSLNKDETTIPAGGYIPYVINLTNRLDQTGYIDFSVTGLDSVEAVLSQPRIYAVPGERNQIYLDVDIPKDYDVASAPQINFMVNAFTDTISVSKPSVINIVSTPKAEKLMPETGIKTGSTTIVFTWNSGIEGTSRVLIKPEGGVWPEQGYGDDVPVTNHKVKVENLTRGTTYVWKALSTGTGGTYESEERTLVIDAGISFDKNEYEFTVEKAYNQKATLKVKNNDIVPQLLNLSIENPYDDLILGFMGGGSSDYPVPVNAGFSQNVDLALHLQDATVPEYNIVAKITSKRGTEILESSVPVKIKVIVPIIDYEIIEVESNPVTLVKKFKVTNKGDLITDFNILFGADIREAVVVTPDVTHYQLQPNETFYFHAIPLLGHPIFQEKFGASNTVTTVNAKGEKVTALASNRRVTCSVGGMVRGLGRPRDPGMHKSMGSKSCQILASAIPDSSFNAPDGTTPRSAKLPRLNYKAEAKTWHCTNRPIVSVDVPVPPMDVDDDPLYIDFTPSSSWEQKPHDVYVYLNDHLIASYKNQIPVGTKKIEFDPSILKIPKAGIAKNRVDIRTVHMNGGHYVVSSNVRFKMRLGEYNAYVMATSDDEALALAEQNLPENIQKAPQSLTFDPVVKPDKIVEGTPTVLKITPKLPNGQKAKQIEIWANVLGEKIPFTDPDGDGVYEGTWTPSIPDDQNTFINSKSLVRVKAVTSVPIEYETKDGDILTDEMDVEESDLNVDILTPESGFDISVGQSAVIKAKVTNSDGEPVNDPDSITISFSSGDAGGSMESIGGGVFTFTWTPDEANTNYPGSTQITVSASHSEFGTASDTVPGKVSKDVDIEIKSVKHKYGGHFFAIDGVSHKVEITVEVDWKKQKEAGSVIFQSTKGTETVKAESLTEPVKYQLDVGTGIGAGGTLKVKAITADSQGESEWKDVELTITKQIPLQSALALSVEDEGSSFKYGSATAAAMEFIKPAMTEDTIPSWVPLFGKKPFLCEFIPKIGVEFKSDGSGKYSLAWETDRLKAEKDVKIRGKACGAEFQLTPKVDIEGNAVKTKGDWKWGGKVGAEGKGEISKSWPFIFTLGPVPIPCYLKAALSVTLTGMVGITDFSASKWQYAGDVTFNPYGRGSLGVGADGIASIEGWVGGGSEFEFGWPGHGKTGYKGCKVMLNAGVTFTVWLWDYEWEGIKYEYPGEEPSKSSKASALYAFSIDGLKAVPAGKIIPRDYLASGSSGVFNSRPFPMDGSVGIKAAPGGAAVGALAESVFPHSNPCLTSVNSDLFLAWVADDSSRSSLNRTVLKFASWQDSTGETGWSAPAAVSDDGTADFHPVMVSFDDNSAVIAWENARKSFADTDDLNTFIPELDISAAVYNSSTKTWDVTNVSNNSYFDRTPRLSGSKDNLMLTWISNENNDIKGSTAKPNKVMYSLYKNSAWSTPAAAAEVKYRISSYDVLYNGLMGYIVMAVNTEEPALPDKDLINDETVVQTMVNSRELVLTRFIGGTWNPLETLTSNETPDDNPQLVFDGNTAIMVWLKNNELAWVKNFAMDMSEVFSQITEYSSNIASAKLVQGKDNRFALIWPEASGYSSDIFTMLYDSTHQAWGRPKQLTNDEPAERNISGAFYNTSSLVAVYNRKNITVNTTGSVMSLGTTIEIAVPETISTDLFMLKYDMGHNLAVKDKSLFVIPGNPLPGTGVSIEVTVVNAGDRTAENAVVAFYQGDPAENGTEISRTVIDTPLLPGSEYIVNTSWTVPANLTDPAGIRLFAVVDPDSVLDTDLRGDNYMSAMLVKPDLAILSASWERTSDSTILFKVLAANTGAIDTAAAKLDLRDATADTLLQSYDIPVLTPGSVHGVTYEWNTASLSRPYYILQAVADPGSLIDEISRLNNYASASADGNQQDIAAVPESYDFNAVALGADYAKSSFRIINRGSASLILGQAVITGSAGTQFKIADDTVSTNVLKPLDSAIITILYSPDAAGVTHEASLDIPSDDPDTPVKSIALKGIGKADILLHSLVISPNEVTVKGNETFDLSNIIVTAQYSDGSINNPDKIVWTIYSTDGITGTVGNSIYSAPDLNRIVELEASYTIGAVKKSARLKVKVVSPKTPVISDLKIAPTRGDLGTYNTSPVELTRLVFLEWSGYDQDSVYSTNLYWSLTDLVTDSIPRELAKTDSALNRITLTALVDSRIAQTAQITSFVWDAGKLADNAAIFDEGATKSKALYIYALAMDSDAMPRTAGTQIIKAVQTLKIVKPTDNSLPEFAFVSLDQQAQTSDSDSFDFTYKAVDKDSDIVGVSFYYHPNKDDNRALQCYKAGQAGASLFEQFTGENKTLADAADKTASWDVSTVLAGTYYIMAKVTDNKHESFNVWSSNPVNITHPVANIAPSFVWVTPSAAKTLISDGASEETLTFKISDDDNDALSISIYYSPVNFVNEQMASLEKTFTLAQGNTQNTNTLSFTVDTNSFNAGNYYFLARVTETSKSTGIYDKWTRVPMVIDRSTGIEYLTVTPPRPSAAAEGKACFDIGFRTSSESSAKILYGLNGFTNMTAASTKSGLSHLITLDELEPGKSYSFKIQAEILSSGKIFTKDNQNRLYRIGIPASLGAQIIEPRYVRGKINHDTPATIKVYLVDKSVTPQVMSKALVTRTDENGEWAVNIAMAVTGTSNERMSVDETRKIRVEIVSDDNKFLYFEDLDLTGISYAKTAFTGLAPQELWASGSGIQLVKEDLEHSMPLVKGFNLVALAIEPLTPMKAKEVLEAIGTNASAIYYYSAVESGYQSYLRLDASRFMGNNFDIDFSTAFFIKMTDSGELKLKGTKISKPVNLNALKGFNMLTVSYGRDFPASLDTDFTAVDLLKSFGSDGIAIYAYVNGGYRSVLRIKDGDTDDCFLTPNGNFTLKQGDGYFIKTREDSSINTEIIGD
jgi:subtilase family serine protease